MKINTQGSGIDLTPAINDYLSQKIGAIEKFIDLGDDSAILDIEVGKTTNHHKTAEDLFRAEFNLQWGGKQYFAAAEKSDLYAAIDEVKGEIVRLLERSKDKEDTLIRKGGQEGKDMLKGTDSD